SGIALGTLVVITGYHALRAFAPAHLKTQEPLLDEGTSSYDTSDEGADAGASGGKGDGEADGEGGQRARS
ncbi:nitrate reductase, partial [Streptomyces beijiangensis]|nr:nitrate reductase [Streptomyces beijiangensis]